MSETPQAAKPAPIRLLKSLFTVSGMTLVSRVSGFIRTILFAGVIGAGPVADAFYTAFRLPNMFRRLVAEGAFQAAFVPLFAGRLEAEGRAEAKKFAEEVMAVLVVALTGLTALAEIATPLFVYVLASGFSGDPEKFDLAVAFTRITFPYLLFMSLVGLMSGVLNSFGRFFAAAAAPVLLNVFLISIVIIFAQRTDVVGYGLSWGVFAAGFAQFAALYIACRWSGVALRLRLPKITPGVKRLIALGTPGFVAAGAIQINLIIGTNIASREAGAVSWLSYADLLYQLPLSVIGIAMGVVLLPDLSRRFRAGDAEGGRASLNRALEITTLLAAPAAAAFVSMPIFLADALFRDLPEAILGASEFGAQDAAMTGRALAAFGAGLPAFVLVKILSPAFFAQEDTKTPMQFALFSIAINTVLAIGLFFWIGFLGVAVATSFAAWLNAGMLAARLHARGLFAPDARLTSRGARIIVAAILMGAALAAAVARAQHFASALGGREWLVMLIFVLGGAIVYGGLCLALGAARLSELRALARRGR